MITAADKLVNAMLAGKGHKSAVPDIGKSQPSIIPAPVYRLHLLLVLVESGTIHFTMCVCRCSARVPYCQQQVMGQLRRSMGYHQ